MAIDATGFQSPAEAAAVFRDELVSSLRNIRNIDTDVLKVDASTSTTSIVDVLDQYSVGLQDDGKSADVRTLHRIKEKITTDPAYGGLGLTKESTPTPTQFEEVLFQTSAYLESVNSNSKARNFLSTNPSHSSDGGPQHPMTLAQKIFLQHALSGVPSGQDFLSTNTVIRAGIDWIIASELSWKGMAQTYEELGSPGIWRNDRFWIAGDHVVHPTIMDNPKIKTYIETAEKAKKDFKMTEYQGMNYTIMHTEFVRERAEPGMLIMGSDSHTCSAGAVGCLSIGLGGADVMMTLALGETWFKVPESVLIELKGKPAFGISGKDVILHILKILKRNTVAAERIVEFDGEGCQWLSVDARFAICNMCTEFGAITGAFVPDAITRAYVEERKRRTNRINSVYFKPDEGAPYAERCTIDLSEVEPSIAVYPDPDHVVPVSDKSGMQLDGVFVGACTTTEEELVLGGLVLKAGLAKGLPLAKGKRHYVPGSLPIVEKLRELGVLEIYEAAGFTRGPPGCSLCVGLSAEKASEGETWLSSQNRNFKNRMGHGKLSQCVMRKAFVLRLTMTIGSFGHLSSAVVCAASSFSMEITDPAFLLDSIDVDFFNRYKGINSNGSGAVPYAEPKAYEELESHAVENKEIDPEQVREQPSNFPSSLASKIVTLGDFIDTDALAPGFTLTSCTTDEEFGQHVLCHTHPDFRDKVKSGQKIVVAGNAFGVGSSRECAVSALKGAGVQAVIAKSFAFIYGRNQPSLGLLGIVMTDETFYEAAKEGEEISIDLPKRKIVVGGQAWGFELSTMEEKLTQHQGVAASFRKFGKGIWETLTNDGGDEEKPGGMEEAESGGIDGRLKW